MTVYPLVASNISLVVYKVAYAIYTTICLPHSWCAAASDCLPVISACLAGLHLRRRWYRHGLAWRGMFSLFLSACTGKEEPGLCPGGGGRWRPLPAFSLPPRGCHPSPTPAAPRRCRAQHCRSLAACTPVRGMPQLCIPFCGCTLLTCAASSCTLQVPY